MFCNKCGEEFPDGAKFCPKCGHVVTNTKKEERKSTTTARPTTSTSTTSAGSGGGIFEWWKDLSNGRKLVTLIVCCCVGWIIISAIMGGLTPDENTSYSDSDIKLIKETTSGWDYEDSDGDMTYYYDVEGVIKNLPDKGEGYTLQGTFYGDDGYVKTVDSYLDLDYSYDDFEDSTPTTLVSLSTSELINITDVDIVVLNPDGDVVLNETVDFKMSNLDLDD